MNTDDALIITEKCEGDLYLAARNLPKIDIRDVVGIDPVSLINYEKVIVTAQAIKNIEEMMK